MLWRVGTYPQTLLSLRCSQTAVSRTCTYRREISRTGLYRVCVKYYFVYKSALLSSEARCPIMFFIVRVLGAG